MNRKMWENILSLYGVHVFTYFVPLLTLPYLARTLGLRHWGELALADAYGTYLTLFIEYGFGLSASREIARARDDSKIRSAKLAGVIGAQALLTAIALAVTVLLFRWVPSFGVFQALLPYACVLGIARAVCPVWYFLGLERMRFIAILNVTTNAASAVAIFLLVHSPNDTWIPLALRAFGATSAAAIALVIAFGENPFAPITFARTQLALREGGSLFLFKSAVSLYTTLNVLILGVFAAPSVVALYAGAEKIARAATGGIQPIAQSFYPRLNHLLATDRGKASETLRASALLTIGVGLSLGAALVIAAPQIIRISLGAGFDNSIPVLRLLAVLVPLVAVSNVLGMQWMLALKLDRAFNKIILSAGATNLLLATLLARRFGPMGMAASVVSADAVVTLGIIVVLRAKRLDPWSRPRESTSLLRAA